MDIKEEIKTHIRKQGSTLVDVSNKLNMSAQNLNNKLTNETIRYKEVKDIADIINCEIKWMPKSIYYNSHETIKSNIVAEKKITYNNYFDLTTEDIFLHGVKQLSENKNIPISSLYIEMLNFLYQKYLFDDNKHE